MFWMRIHEPIYQIVSEKELAHGPYHVLAFDMIYSSQVYNLYDGIQYDHPKGTEKKLHRERMEKAAALKESYEQARADFECLEEIRAVILSHLQAGSNIIHKVYGTGTIVSMEGQAISIQFPAQAEPKKFMLLPSLGGGFLRLGTEDDLLVQSNAKLLQMDGSLERRLKSAEAALEPYQQYL